MAVHVAFGVDEKNKDLDKIQTTRERALYVL